MTTIRQILSGIGIGIAIMAVFAIGMYVYQTHTEPSVFADLLCPSQYSTAEAAAASFQTFVTDYEAIHPNATMHEILDARVAFYQSHHCTQELERYQQAMSGTADPAGMATVNAAIQDVSQ